VTSTIKVWTFDDFISTEIPEEPYLVNPLIPKHGVTLMHGPAGAGKSALGFHLVEKLHNGEEFLGLETVRANSLYLNLEMPQQGLHYRLKKAGFGPKAYLINHPPIEMLQPGFQSSVVYRELKSIVEDLGVECVVIDNLGTLSTESTSDDNVARKAIAILREWFSDRAVVVIHHNRKMKFNQNSGEWVVSDEDASGSKYWINSSASVIHVKHINGDLRVVAHTKSQIMKMLEREVKFQLADDGIHIEIYDTREQLLKAEANFRRLNPDWDQTPEVQKVAHLANVLGKSTATIYRWRKQGEKAGDE